MSKRVVISFKVSPQDKQLLIDMARSRGITLSEYCQSSIMKSCFSTGNQSEGRGERILSQDDLDAIAGRVAIELEALEIPRSSAPPKVPIPDPEKSVDLIARLGLIEEYETNLRDYVQRAMEAHDLTATEVITRMLAAAYEDYHPNKKWWIDLNSISQFDRERLEDTLSEKR